MTVEVKRIAFGPVPSRRLGKSIGINNIPPKICTYSCVYCQLGRTYNIQAERQVFYEPKDILNAVQTKITQARGKNERIDYLTFVPDGEPTLDRNLKREIELLHTLGIKIAVITNASLLWKQDVRDDLMTADWVSLKVDTIDEHLWHRINRPSRSLKLKEILDGISAFSHSFTGDLVTETMLMQGVNDTTEEVKKVATFISGLHPRKSYLSIPIRPPAEPWVNTATEETLNRAFQLFNEQEIETEYLISYEGNAFAYTGNLEEDVLGIMSVHPIREDGMRELLSKADASWSFIEKLLMQQKVIETTYHGKKFYIRKLPTKPPR
jgi:wyosine [tRNA(Phe)-imidazoG37] synthetase (radical SAM superfamily)